MMYEFASFDHLIIASWSIIRSNVNACFHSTRKRHAKNCTYSTYQSNYNIIIDRPINWKLATNTGSLFLIGRLRRKINNPSTSLSPGSKGSTSKEGMKYGRFEIYEGYSRSAFQEVAIAKLDAGKFEAFIARSARPVIGAENCAHVTWVG